MGGDRLVVAGPARGHVLSSLPPNATVVGVRFGPGATGAALGLPAHELQDRTVDLAELWGLRACELADRLEAARPERRLALLTTAVAARLREAAPPDELVAHAAGLLGTGLPVAETGREVGLGDRHLRRRFHHAVGYGPKTLQRVLRLRRFLALADATSPPDLARAAVDAGFFDQPHLTRECTDLTGLPPAALLAARQPRAETVGLSGTA
jgi:methylphosphotriester-DNA--protein-cysteine methyltransferase